jgi:hypothetical protein
MTKVYPRRGVGRLLERKLKYFEKSLKIRILAALSIPPHLWEGGEGIF